MLISLEGTDRYWPLVIFQAENVDDWHQLEQSYDRICSIIQYNARNIDSADGGTLDPIKRQLVLKIHVDFH